MTLRDRAEWMRRGCGTILRRIGYTLEEQGEAPFSGLIVSNHLSHLDILFYSAASGCILISKSEVERWPLFGLLARCGGNLFVEREKACAAAHARAAISEALSTGVPVLLFAEGTSTDGGQVLPFRSMLFQPAIDAEVGIQAAAIGYSGSGTLESDLCYYGSRCFLPHLAACMGIAGVRGRLDWGQPAVVYGCRKRAARAVYAAVLAGRSRVQARTLAAEEMFVAADSSRAGVKGLRRDTRSGSRRDSRRDSRVGSDGHFANEVGLAGQSWLGSPGWAVLAGHEACSPGRVGALPS